jgi:hypothetical protein
MDMAAREVRREALFVQLVSAYRREDYDEIEDAMTLDVVLELPGHSSFAGEHLGAEAVARYIAGMRKHFVAARGPITFEHEGNTLVVSQIGQLFAAEPSEMIVNLRITFDAHERVERVQVEADDIDAFDNVVAVLLEGADQ